MKTDSQNETPQRVGALAPWFAIRGAWLHIQNERINLAAVTRYYGSGDSVTLYQGQWSTTTYGQQQEGDAWDARSKELLAALDAFFANDRDEPTRLSGESK